MSVENQASGQYIFPGTKVRRNTSDETTEVGVVVHCWLCDEINAYDCYVAFFGESFPEGKPAEKPYILRYSSRVLTTIEE